jgi:photosystem II stability/assembly factor-like uncharacterized protein
MSRVLSLSLILLLNLFSGSCGQEVRWENLPQIKSMAFVGPACAWLVTAKGDLLRTQDGGRTWQKTPAETIAGFQSATMLNDRSGLAVNSHGKVWSTVDGGQTWTVKAELKAEDWHFNESNQIHFLDELHGWIIEALSIWRTEDGGTNWQKAFSPYDQKAKGQPVRAFFLDLRQVWVCGSDGEVYSTKDGGENWVTQTVSGKNSDFRDVFFIDEKTGWLVGYTGGRFGSKLYHTSDSGKTWQLLPTAINQGYLNSIYFLNEREGWACGEAWTDDANANAGKGILLHTVDGAQSWQSTFTKDDEPFFDRIWFVDRQHAWLFGRDNVYRTDDGGKSWQATLRLQPVRNEP